MSWGRLSAEEHQVRPLGDRLRVPAELAATRPGLAYGMGRSYGDVCLNPGGTLWMTRGLDRFISFDPHSGRLRCESGVLLKEIQELAVPLGWSVPVTPGTQFVTIGGAIANDVHGKNHHRRGSFGDHVTGLSLARTDDSLIQCGPATAVDWFAATVGGMGLTGVITEVELQLQPVPGPWLATETVPFEGLAAFFELSDASEAGWEFTVSWIDCLAGADVRGIFMRANAVAQAGEMVPDAGSLTMPFVPPVSLVNRLSLRPFNRLYHALQKRKAGHGRTHYQPFFYPLDKLLEWNRMYGPRGFFQYQCVVPREIGLAATADLLAEIASAGAGSFLAVLKTFGAQRSRGMLGFPRPGVTLALDFPNQGDATLRLFERLDAIVAAAGGALYPAKDARMPRALFEAAYPRHAEFQDYRDPGISSAMSRRLLGW
jgi:FAD/FMN-containing dehydrogenase